MSLRRRPARTAVLAFSLMGCTALIAGPVSAGGSHAVLSDPIASGLVSPLQIAVTNRGDVVVGQSFIGVLTKVGARGATDLATNPAGSVGGVDVKGRTVVYATRDGEQAGGPGFGAALMKLTSSGPVMVADLWAYEQSANPDQVNTYGWQSITPDCAALLPPEIGPPSYPGQLDTNPYAVLISGAQYYVADAGGNAILAVSKAGAVRTVAVLPPQPTVITAEAAAANGLPDCVAGLTYHFEPVPTDVEIGYDGKLYVTTLPGGPEDPSLGARGSVYRIDPRRGTATLVATGFLGATNLALDSHGHIYVAELFGGKVSRVDRHGNITTVVELPFPAAIEFAHGKLYVSYDVFGDGKVATIRDPGHH
jgi:hypothetical protein